MHDISYRDLTMEMGVDEKTVYPTTKGEVFVWAAQGEEADPKYMHELYSMNGIAKHEVMAISFSLSN